MDSLTDVVLHMNYTAREGGDPLRDGARAFARHKLPGNGWVFIDLRKDFADVWESFRRARKNREAKRNMTIKVSRKLFPFLPGDPALQITKLAVLFETEEQRERPCPEPDGCPCAQDDTRGSQLVEVTVDRQDDDRDDTDEVEIVCQSSADWPDLYHGMGDVKVAPFDRRHHQHDLVLTFADLDSELTRAYLLCRYEVIDECCQMKRPVVREP